ncbi:MAG: pseudouridine synthase [Desulfohalobiaceae bacterium]
MRLNKFLSRTGICSRRRADELIAAGRVSVDGNVVSQLGLRVDPDRERISVDGTPVASPRQDMASHVYLALHKPARVVTTLSDPQNRTTVVDLLPRNLRGQRVLPAGRLDYFSEGLLILSTDGEFLNRVTHPRYHLPKTYSVKIKGGLSRKKLDTACGGMRLEGSVDLAPVPVEVLESPGKGIHWLRFTLRQGINRQIRRMCRQLDWTVLRLIRTAQGPVELGGLQPGSCRHLESEEIRALLRGSEV